MSENVFGSTYANIGGDRYRKSATVTAVSIDEPFSVITLEGPSSGTPGDWLVRNPTGECWPVPNTVFTKRCERV